MTDKLNFKQNRPILYTGLILFIICSVAGVLLSLTYEYTKKLIADKKASVSISAFKTVLPSENNDYEPIEVSDQFYLIKEIYKSEGNGYCFYLTAKGYKGDDIELVLGINDVGVISGVVIVSHSETPGLGSNITKASFLNQFIGKKAEEGLELVKVDQGADNEIDAITGATKSSRGVVDAINQACNYYVFFLREEEAPNGENN